MKTISELVAEVHQTKAEYLKSTLIGPQEILAFANALREQVLEEAAQKCENLPAQQDIDVRDQCAAALRGMK